MQLACILPRGAQQFPNLQVDLSFMCVFTPLRHTQAICMPQLDNTNETEHMGKRKDIIRSMK
jgi:hypothetical protein